MSTDIRRCNICIQGSVDGEMHYCNFCRRFICTRTNCIEKHDTGTCDGSKYNTLACTAKLGPETVKKEPLHERNGTR